MVEVFRTNVGKKKEANFLLDRFQRKFPNFKINFDLEDCDNILRVETDTDLTELGGIIDFMHVAGFTAEALPDE